MESHSSVDGDGVFVFALRTVHGCEFLLDFRHATTATIRPENLQALHRREISPN